MSYSRKTMLRGSLAFLFISTGLIGCADKTLTPNIALAGSAEAEATFYLVRHAEKILTGDDPALSEVGYARAEALSQTLSGVKFDGIYSTDTRRTRDTATPTLAGSGLELKLYNGRDLGGFAQSLTDASGNYLIVGHSNTTPDLAEALGGEGGAPIVEADEYDRLYVLTRTGGAVVTDLRRYP